MHPFSRFTIVAFIAASTMLSSQQVYAADGMGMGTRGRTDGEPGSNVEAHCCGMKGKGCI